MAEKKSPHHFQGQANAENEHNGDEHYISKSQAKRDVEALQKLGEKLVLLSSNVLEKFTLDERLKDEILFAQSIRSHSARRRQLQLIGKLMRHADYNSIQQQYDRYQNQLGETNARFHTLEHWRDRILAEGDPAINELLTEQPALDRSRLRQLLRNARKEAENNKPPKSSRQLFKYLKEIMDEEN